MWGGGGYCRYMYFCWSATGPAVMVVEEGRK